jgi:hypothetical protein
MEQSQNREELSFEKKQALPLFYAGTGFWYHAFRLVSEQITENQNHLTFDFARNNGYVWSNRWDYGVWPKHYLREKGRLRMVAVYHSVITLLLGHPHNGSLSSKGRLPTLQLSQF